MNNKDFAPGLPSKFTFSDINQSGPTRLVVQQHDAERAGKHYDVRLHDNDKTLSWVIKSLPGEKKKILAIRQPDHRAVYSDFEGIISEGYGKGDVKKVYDEKVNVLKADNHHIKLELPEGFFTMIKPKKFGKNNWLMIKTSSIENPITSKPKYKTISEPSDYSDDNKVLQPKIDGSHSLFHLKSKNLNDIYSYRTSKKTGEPIDHSAQLPKLRNLPVPSSFNDTVLRGDLYAHTDHKPMPAEQIGGILNSDVSKSISKQKEHGWLKPYIFDIVKFKGKDVSQEPYLIKYDLMKQVESRIPELRVAETAFTPNQKRRLLESIKRKKHPDTEEGVVEWDLNKATGSPGKLKFRDTHDVYIREIYPAISQKTGKEKNEAGGFKYSWTPKGKIVGNVGTGFNQQKRIDLLQHSKDYIGMVARVKSPQKYESGALRAPAFYAMDIEKNLQKTAELAFINELEKIAISNR